MPSITEEGQEQSFEIINLKDDKDQDWLKKMYRDITKASAAKQITVGGVSGWCAGYLFSKVGKAAATALGGSLLLLQIAQHRGYIKINWTQVEREIKEASQRVEATASSQNNTYKEYIDGAKKFVEENMFLAGGFSGGFLIGLAS